MVLLHIAATKNLLLWKSLGNRRKYSEIIEHHNIQLKL